MAKTLSPWLPTPPPPPPHIQKLYHAQVALIWATVLVAFSTIFGVPAFLLVLVTGALVYVSFKVGKYSKSMKGFAASLIPFLFACILAALPFLG